jgi:hypothetical protein
LFDLQDQWDRAVQDLSSYIPVEVEHRVQQLNGFEMPTREVLIKGTSGLSEGDIAVGGNNPLVLPEHRLLVDRQGEAMKFFAVRGGGGAVRVEALSIGVADAAGGVSRIGRAAGVDVGLAGLLAFSHYLQRNGIYGGSLSAELNMLNGSVVTAGVKSATFVCMTQYKTAVRDLVAGVAPAVGDGPPVGGFVQVLNVANDPAGGGAALFDGNTPDTFAVTAGWAADPTVLSGAQAEALVGCLTNTQAIVFGGPGGRETTFIDFYNRLVGGLGHDVKGATEQQKFHNDNLEADRDRRDETSAVDSGDEQQNMVMLGATYRFTLEALHLLLDLLKLSSELIR